MLQNFLKLRTAAGKDQDFFDKIQVATLGISADSIELCYYWATQDQSGDITYYGRTFGRWATDSTGYKAARRSVRNALDWIVAGTRARISSDLEALEQRYQTERRIKRGEPAHGTHMQTPAPLEPKMPEVSEAARRSKRKRG